MDIGRNSLSALSIGAQREFVGKAGSSDIEMRRQDRVFKFFSNFSKSFFKAGSSILRRGDKTGSSNFSATKQNTQTSNSTKI